MKIDINPAIAALLQARVAAGQFTSLEEALAAAVLGIGDNDSAFDEQAWAKPYLSEAKASLARGEGLDDDAVWTKLEQRFGPIV